MNRTFNPKALMLALVLLVLTSTQSRAALPVVDYGNLTQSLLQVTHAVTQIQNQIQQINQMAQTLQTIGGSQYASVAGGLNGQLQEMQNTLGTLTQVSQSVGNIQNEFNTLVPDQASWDNYDFSNFGGKLDEWSTEIDNATIEAMTAQGIVQRAALNVTNVNALLAESQTADGEVRQLQLLNQSMGILAQQMNDSLQLLAANGRLEAALAAQQEKSREAARARKTKMMQNLGKAEYDTAPLSHLP